MTLAAFVHHVQSSDQSPQNGLDPISLSAPRGIGNNRIDRIRRIAIAASMRGDERGPMKCQMLGIGLRLVPRHVKRHVDPKLLT